MSVVFEQLNSGACKTYLIACSETGEAMLVDPILEHSERYLAEVRQRGLHLRFVVDTHLHADHLSGGAAIKEMASVPYAMHRASPGGCIDLRIEDGQVLELGEERRRNKRLVPRTREEYMTWLAGMQLGPAEWMNDVLRANTACTRDAHAVAIPTDARTCEATPMAEGVDCISIDDLRQGLDAVVLLDVRQTDELTGALGHIQGAISVPLAELPARLAELEPLRDRRIVATCKAGARSATAAALLKARGFDVRVLEGGMTAWNERRLHLGPRHPRSVAGVAGELRGHRDLHDHGHPRDPGGRMGPGEMNMGEKLVGLGFGIALAEWIRRQPAPAAAPGSEVAGL